VNREAFEKLPPAVQATLRKTVHDAQPWFTDTMKQEDGETIRNITGKLTITSATAEDAAKAATTMAPYWDEWAKAAAAMPSRPWGRCAPRSGDRMAATRHEPSPGRAPLSHRGTAEGRSSGPASSSASRR